MDTFATKKGIAISDEKEQIKSQLQHQLEPRALLATDRNRWFAVALALALVCLALSVLSIAAIQKDKTIEIYWVKMYPNGRWEIDAPKADRDVEFYPRAIDHFLERWVVSRYSELKHEVSEHYGFAATFMSPELAHDFRAPDGFNAVEAASDIKECASCPQVHVAMRDINHNNAIKTQFGRTEGILYRSDVYITRTIKNADGSTKDKTYHIIPLKWRLKTKAEIKADLLNPDGEQRLRANPIGIEIRDYNILNDHKE
jgi:hypothetical protein